MRFNLKLAALALCAVPLSACNVWTVPEFSTWDSSLGDPQPGDRLDVEMVDATIDGWHPWDRCMNMGGRGMFHSTKEVAVASSADDIVLTAILSVIICESVDF